MHTHKYVIYRRLASRAHAAPRLQPRAGSRIDRRLHSGDGQHPKLQNCILKLQAKGYNTNGMLNNNNNKTVHLLISFQSQSSVQLFVAQ